MEKDGEILHYRVALPNEIYTNVDQFGLNMPPHLVYCEGCKYQIVTNLAGSQCVKCNRNLLFHIPHNEQLVRPNS